MLYILDELLIIIKYQNHILIYDLAPIKIFKDLSR